MAKKKCDCKPIVGIGGLLLMTLGIYFLVWGFKLQTNSVISWSFWNWNAMVLYLVGILSIGFGKMLKHRGSCDCKIHSMK